MTPSLYAAERGTGPTTIALLHGFGGCHDDWRDVAASLALGARTLAYDLPGHGLSLDFPGGGPARIAASAVLADFSARGIKRAHLVGHSMGGAVAALMALNEPEKIASLTLLAPGGFGPEINGPLLRRYAAAAGTDEVRACLAAMSGPQSRPSQHRVELVNEMRQRPGQLRTLVELAAAMTRDDRQGVIPSERLETLNMPIMVVWGTDDAMLPVSQADGLPKHFHLHRVLEAGHMLVEEAPGLVVEAVRRNMRRRSRRLRPELAAAAN